jgi:hypothetical protein
MNDPVANLFTYICGRYFNFKLWALCWFHVIPTRQRTLIRLTRETDHTGREAVTLHGNTMQASFYRIWRHCLGTTCRVGTAQDNRFVFTTA